MEFALPLQQGMLIQRYKRFLADVVAESGTELTLHCPNTGSMKNCAEPNSRVWYWDSANDKRKYPCTWELVEVEQQYLACINTQRANGLVVEAIQNGTIKELQGYQTLKTEVKYGKENSRIDIVLSQQGSVETSCQKQCYVEVKNVTMRVAQGKGLGVFPDAVTERGRKHLRELAQMVADGHRAVLVYCVAHTGIDHVAPAWEIDRAYCETLLWAVAQGVEVLAYGANISFTEMALTRPLTIDLKH